MTERDEPQQPVEPAGVTRRDFMNKTTVAGAYRFSVTPWALRRPAPCLGQHNNEVYGRVGISQTELDGLKIQGVI